MEFVEKKIMQILCTLPNECAYLDYKVIPYQKHEYPELIRDVISMLNTDEAIGKDKVIILGVDDQRNLIGIDSCQMDNDANYQNLFNKITPRPHILTGLVDYADKKYGFILIFADNNDRVYEVAEVVYGEKEALNIKNFAACQGQAYSRRGSQKYIMMREHRERLNSVKIQPELSATNISPIVCMSPDNALLTAAIIGGWNEDSPNDIELLEHATGEIYSSWIQRINKLRVSMPEVIICKGKTWGIENRVDIFTQTGKFLYDSQVDLLCNQFRFFASYYDPKYDLPSDQRFASGFYGEKRLYSKILLYRFSEFWTLANVNESLFTSCSKYKIKNSTVQVIESVLNCDNWKVIASFEGVFQLFAEAAPEYYMKTIQYKLRNADSGLKQYLHESEVGVSETKYGAPLYRSLAVLARFPQYFSDACYTLMLIAKENRTALSTLTGVMLPWCPQTLASLSVRKGLLAGLLAEDQELGWELGISLLPGKTTTGFPADDTLYLSVGDIPETVSMKDYWEVSLSYLKNIISKAYGNVEHLLEIIEFFDNVHQDGFDVLFECLNNSAAQILDIDDRYLLWDALLSFATKHRRFSDSDWVLSEEKLKRIDLLIDLYCPLNRIVQARRLFKTGQYDLIIEEDYEVASAKLQEMQNAEIRYIWSEDQLKGLLTFVTEIDCAYKVGVSLQLAGIEHIDDYALEIVSLLASDNSKVVEFCKGYVINHFQLDDEQTKAVLRDFDDVEIKARFLALFPMTIRIKQYLDTLKPDEQDIFWRETSQYHIDISNSDELDYIADELVKHSRAVDAIEIIVRCIHNHIEPSSDCIYCSLCDVVDTSNNYSQLNVYNIIRVIEWMQKHEVDEARKVEIEWKFLNVLKRGYDIEPITLYKKLSNEPQLFIEAISYAYKGRHEPKPDLTEEQLKISKHFSTMLFYWRRTPGLQDDGTINEDTFVSWMAEVSKTSRDLDRFEVAMNLVGKSFFHCPPDQSGLFINTIVARTLQDDSDGFILGGYRTESMNARGVYNVDPTGAPEFALEKTYLDRANEVDSLGMFRFAKILRQIAESYHAEALENIEEERAALQEQE